MEKKLLSILLSISYILSLTGCGHEHNFSKATCTDDAVCECGEVGSKAYGHSFDDATCEEPKTCSECGKTEGEPLGHEYIAATYEKAKHCKMCEKTFGEPLERLSDSYFIISSVSDENGDLYEMVGTQTEDYKGVTCKIGIIKNNKWLLKPTSNMPLIAENGQPIGYDIKSLEDFLIKSNNSAIYIGNGCFFYEATDKPYLLNAIYNADINKAYIKDEHGGDLFCLSYYSLSYISGPTEEPKVHNISKKDQYIITTIINYERTAEIEILDTNTMKLKTVELDFSNMTWVEFGSLNYVYPISNGIFAVADIDGYANIKFFNINGKEVFKSDFRLEYTEQLIVFENGKCTFDIVNEADTPYTVTIDKSGKVISSSKK